MSFKGRLFLFTFLWLCLSSFGITYWYQNQHNQIELNTKQRLHQHLAAHMRDDHPLMIGTDYNPVALKSIFHTLMLIGPDFELYFLDSQGYVRSHAAPDGVVVTERVSLDPIHDFLTGKPFPILGDDPRRLDGRQVFSVAPIRELNSVVGYLYVVIGSEQHKNLLNGESKTPLFFTLLLSLASIIGLSGGLYLLVQFYLLRPIKTITQDLQYQVEHDFQPKTNQGFTHKLKLVSELNPIAQQFDHAAHRIQQQFLHIDSQARSQRQQLMQLNHDLKTPLSSILGYLETWLFSMPPTTVSSSQGHNEGYPAKKLIEIAYKNAQRLSEQLQQQLLIAKQSIENQAHPYIGHQMLSIDVVAIMTECLESIGLQISQKGIQLAIDKPASVIVEGDPQLLARLFDNLLENAIRHSPKEGVIAIVVNAASDARVVNVSIRNEIDKDAQKGSLGVGVKIITSILVLHHSVLLTSSDDETYQQSFTLPLAF
ncbi:hypothetical protein BCU68_15920 [Vibrio sp. 10N.286.49.B3]|uniref:sensor histidine kinase n=1 Tax=Vibrio sp. 10N.286.49.B3 TaxID=1880855 RepID=UPI000C83042F|nr:HAMP domain-containing sensor histidine kinase [Vibrio sp. 10N.286.49.B3]PMH40856.1 hypothetical protein BCU68_15920 [Vibrio sp. 10N.286.49.B3]